MLCDLGIIPGSDSEAFKKLVYAIYFGNKNDNYGVVKCDRNSEKKSLVYLFLHKKASRIHSTAITFDDVGSKYLSMTGILKNEISGVIESLNVNVFSWCVFSFCFLCICLHSGWEVDYEGSLPQERYPKD